MDRNPGWRRHQRERAIKRKRKLNKVLYSYDTYFQNDDRRGVFDKGKASAQCTCATCQRIKYEERLEHRKFEAKKRGHEPLYLFHDVLNIRVIRRAIVSDDDISFRQVTHRAYELRVA